VLTADSVYNIAKALSKEELRELYARIGEDLKKDQNPNGLPNKPNYISDEEIWDMVMTRIFNVKTG
jgi:hypothetical protein